MSRVRLILAALLLATLAGGLVAPASAAPDLLPLEVECESGTVMYGLPTRSMSWTLHELGGTGRLVVHRWTVHYPEDDGGPQTWVDRAMGNPRLERCWTTCPRGNVIEIWGIRTPAGGR